MRRVRLGGMRAGTTYQELRADYFDRPHRDRAIRRHVRQLDEQSARGNPVGGVGAERRSLPHFDRMGGSDMAPHAPQTLGSAPAKPWRSSAPRNSFTTSEAMADLMGGHLVARTLKEAGVAHVFTLCGGHILPLYEGCVSEGIRVIDMRHEQACAHAGDAYARLTRNIGVAVVTAGPGVTDAVTGVANDLMVEALGGRGEYVTEPGEIRHALEKALDDDAVSCVNVILDPAAYRRTGQVSMAI